MKFKILRKTYLFFCCVLFLTPFFKVYAVSDHSLREVKKGGDSAKVYQILKGEEKGPLVSKVELISPYHTLSSSLQKIPIGLMVTLKKGWHSYWHFPGESGKALKIHWTLPPGAFMSPLKWPLPQRIRWGSLTSFGYKESFLLISELSLRKPLPLHSDLKIQAQVEWFVCQKVCVPLRKNLSIKWPVRANYVNDSKLELFNQYTQQIPQNQKKALVLNQEGAYWKAHVLTKKPLKLMDVFPFSKSSFALDPPLVFSKPDGYTHSFKVRPLSQAGGLSAKGGDKKNKMLLIFKDKAHKRVGFVYTLSKPQKNQAFKQGVLWFLLLSFLGGILLNFMPCVLPLVFLKFSNTVQQADQKRSVIVLENLLYSVGVISSFLLLGFLIFLLRKGGESIGWGFHLQSPYVLLGLIFLFTFISLGFAGWLPLPAWTFGQNNQGGYFKHFLTGVLSTVGASPCTAPFMGAGVGYGLSTSGMELILIFLFLGLGLSFPYLLLSLFPKWIQYVPLPGPWTQKLKHFMVFPMVSTVLCLLFILNQQRAESLFVVLFCVLVLILSFWILKVLSPRLKVLALFFFVIALGGPFFHLYQKGGELRISWAPFSLKKFYEACQEGRSIFINMTAHWCLTCKFNEQITFRNKKVVRFFKEKQVLALKGDWTQPNKEIADFLKLYNRAGIPFYLYIPAMKGEQRLCQPDKLRLLPELLTPFIFFKYTNNKPP